MYLELSHHFTSVTAHKTDSLCSKRALTPLPVVVAQFLSITVFAPVNYVFYHSHHSLPITMFSIVTVWFAAITKTISL